MTRWSWLVALLIASQAVAADWPQHLGPTRDGHSPETGLQTAWPAGGPPKLWQVKVGAGFSGPIVADGQVILHHRVGDDEILQSWDAATGKPRWQHKMPTGYIDQFGFDEGPRSSPSVDGGVVFCLGAEGRLTAVGLKTGQPIWDVELQRKYKFRKGYFGLATSPLVDDRHVYVNVGASDAGIVAFDRKTGAEFWKSGDDEASYSSPVLTQIDGATRLVFLTRTGIRLLDPATGNSLFSQRFRARIQASVNAATPLSLDKSLFFSSSYNTGALLIDAAGKKIWANDNSISAHYCTPVRIGDQLFGIHGRQETGGELRCIDWKTGQVRWTKDGFGMAHLIAIDGRLIAVVESGEVVAISPTVEQYREVSRFTAAGKPIRALPALSDGRLVLRDEANLISFRLTK